MNRRCFPLVAASLMVLSSQAQQVDFNIPAERLLKLLPSISLLLV